MNFNINAAKAFATKSYHAGLFFTKKYSPEILTGLGVVGSVGTTVLASRATLHLETVIDQHQHEVTANKELLQSGHMNTQSYQKELIRTYLTTAGRVGRLYGPSVTLGIASIGCILGAHGIMRKRNLALVAAYKGVEQSFSEYRKRVVEAIGETKERDIYAPTVEKESKDEETGKVTKYKTHDSKSPSDYSQYARFFDEYNPNWKKDPEYNRVFLKVQQQFANDLLLSRGHLFLNEVYDSLGMERTQAGSVVGWVISDDGDNFVDFGLFDFESEPARAFVNGLEPSILLDFNVDGLIYDKI